MARFAQAASAALSLVAAALTVIAVIVALGMHDRAEAHDHDNPPAVLSGDGPDSQHGHPYEFSWTRPSPTEEHPDGCVTGDTYGLGRFDQPLILRPGVVDVELRSRIDQTTSG